VDAYIVCGMVVSGHVWALGEPADEAARQIRLCHENLFALATNVVVPDLANLDGFRSALSDRLCLVVLDPGPTSA